MEEDRKRNRKFHEKSSILVSKKPELDNKQYLKDKLADKKCNLANHVNVISYLF